MTFKVGAWLGLSAGAAFALLVATIAYTWLVFVRAPGEIWSWWHELVATLFSVGLAFTIGVWLYAWQTNTSDADRKLDLRVLLITSVFDIWDRVDDKYLRKLELPDGSGEKVLITHLEPTVFEEGIRSGLFDSTEHLALFRLSLLVHLYNDAVTRLLPVYSSLRFTNGTRTDLKRVVELRELATEIQQYRVEIVQAGQNLLKHWSFDEFQEAMLKLNEPDSGKIPDQRVVEMIMQAQPKVSPMDFTASAYDKFHRALQEVNKGNLEVACELLMEGSKSVKSLVAEGRITNELAQSVISEINQVAESIECPQGINER
jgi:hypothetical protein